jgi:hypothetical protein
MFTGSRDLYHAYGFAGYYAEPFHVLMLKDSYPASVSQPRPAMATMYRVPLNDVIAPSGAAVFRPHLGMDPTDPGTYTRPYAPQRGMFGRLHQDQEQAAREQAKAARAGKGRGSRRD